MDGELSSGCANNGDQENPLAKIAPAPDLTSPSPFKVYKRRWFLLAVVCLVSSSNAMLWLTFAPVADQTAKRFHTTMDMVNWLSIVYLVISVPVGFLAVWILDTVGLKCAVLLCAWLNMTGSIIRIFSVLDFLSLGSLNFAYLLLGQCLCAMAQPLIIFSPTKLAALWFPDHQRATANMIGSMSNPLGLLIANLLSPAIVQEDKDIPLLLGVYAGPAAFACVLATFGVHQKVPPTPPSASAFQSDSLSFSGGLKMLLRNKAYLILAASLGSGIALVTCYSALLEQILCVNGYSDSFAGMCGAFFTVFGLIGAFFLGLYVDRTKKFTEVTKICFCLTALASTAFAVMSHYRNQTYAVATFSALFGLFGFALYPVAMELAVECSYPVGEGTSSGLIFVMSQLLGMLYMFLFQSLAVKKEEAPFSTCTVASGGALDWTTSTLVMAGLSCATACTFVVSFHTDYKRISAETSRGCSVNPVEDGAVTAQS
ncbi:Solute carrier family 49 member A3 [Varanus komodoensis]|uniref:solute carrier family 49 member A3 n=1 Tax=Varanus komodoensis TaxID=61221 RepID=UPI001CF7B7D7|nr:solute carrier family 49 member A3 [Varanus komodoensis]KAF7239988.1 Solute carrier family 49 member A3 [Varanus komodoensis]